MARLDVADPLTITIDVEQIRQDLSASDEREWTADDVMEWLRECGFRYQGRAWHCEAISLRALAPGEYRIVGEREPTGASAAAYKWVCWTAAVWCLILSAAQFGGDPRIGLAFTLAALVFTLAGIPFARRQART